MSADFFYRAYSKFSKRGNSLRLKITPAGMIVISVCVISGITGINIFSSGLYRVFTISLSLIIVSYFGRNKKFPDLKIRVFFDRQYKAGERSHFGVRIYNESKKDIRGIELLPATESLTPSKEEFINIKEPGEEKRNFWDRNIYYFRWLWHTFRKYRVEFESVTVGKIESDSHTTFDMDFLPVRRGHVKFEGFYVLQKSLLGLFYTYRFFSVKEDIIILPKKVKPDREFEKRIALENEFRDRGLHSLAHKHKSGDFVGLREYVPGDPYKNIHWKTWAKTGKPAVVEKGFEKIREYTLILINAVEKPERNISVRFEDLISSMQSVIEFLEKNSYEVNFIYFDRNGKLCQIQADKDRGNFGSLYNIISELECIYKDYQDILTELKPLTHTKKAVMIFSASKLSEVKTLFRCCDPFTTGIYDNDNDWRKHSTVPYTNTEIKVINTV